MLIDTWSPRLAAWRLDASQSEEPDLPTLADVDVAVVGAGASGVAAATTAAEAGLTVVLIEKYGFCGGAAVAGMSGTICGLYAAAESSPAPRQLVYGFAERFRRLLHDRHGLTPPQRYGKTWTVAHDPFVWRDVADRLLINAGVRILFHTAMVGVVKQGDRCSGLLIESNAGRSLVRARRIIDASGDAAVAARAGLSYRFGDHGRIQNPTMFFRLGGVDVDEFFAVYGGDAICPPWVSDKIIELRAQGANLPRQKIFAFKSPHPHELLVNATRLTGSEERPLNVIDPEDFTEAEVGGRDQVRSYAEFMREYLPGCGASYVVDTGVEAGVRQTRTIEGVQTLENRAVTEGQKSPTSICRSAWPIELHDGDRPKLHWLLDDYYDIPFHTLVPRGNSGLIVAGRSLSAQHEALASARVTAQCFEYGHAAGVACALSLTSGRDFLSLDTQEVRAGMQRNGSDL